jgi:hypothetical protein
MSECRGDTPLALLRTLNTLLLDPYTLTVGVEKVPQLNGFTSADMPSRVFWSPVRLSGNRQNGCCRLAEEAH